MTKMENGIFNTPVLAKFKINSSELYFSLLIMNLLIDWKKSWVDMQVSDILFRADLQSCISISSSNLTI